MLFGQFKRELGSQSTQPHSGHSDLPTLALKWALPSGSLPRTSRGVAALAPGPGLHGGESGV